MRITNAFRAVAAVAAIGLAVTGCSADETSQSWPRSAVVHEACAKRFQCASSLALRDGAPEPVRIAIDWYRTHDRLHCGDPVAMATDALAGYRHDVAVGK
jgi:hypothetical protein